MKLTEQEKKERLEARRKARAEAKEQARIEAEKNQPHVKEITITIEWKKSYMWGSNPHAEAAVTFHDHKAGEWGTGFFRKDGYTAGGCGYDKESTVIASIFNDFLKYKLHGKLNDVDEYLNGEKTKIPYGIYINSQWKHYSGGIGTNCYYKIAEAIGGKFEHVASGKTFDVYKYTDNDSDQ